MLAYINPDILFLNLLGIRSLIDEHQVPLKCQRNHQWTLPVTSFACSATQTHAGSGTLKINFHCLLSHPLSLCLKRCGSSEFEILFSFQELLWSAKESLGWKMPFKIIKLKFCIRENHHWGSGNSSACQPLTSSLIENSTGRKTIGALLFFKKKKKCALK